jgi:hypothetical protein
MRKSVDPSVDNQSVRLFEVFKPMEKPVPSVIPVRIERLLGLCPNARKEHMATQTHNAVESA